jgi:hypothetical protein
MGHPVVFSSVLLVNREWLLWRYAYRWHMRADRSSFVILSPLATRRNLPASWPTDRQGVYCCGDGWLQSSQHYRSLSDSRFELRMIALGKICKRKIRERNTRKEQKNLLSVQDKCLWHFSKWFDFQTLPAVGSKMSIFEMFLYRI